MKLRLPISEKEARETFSQNAGYKVCDSHWEAVKKTFALEFELAPIKPPERLCLTGIKDGWMIEDQKEGIAYAATLQNWVGSLDRERLAGLRALVDRYHAYPKLKAAAEELLKSITHNNCGSAEVAQCITNLRIEIEKGSQ